MHHHALPALALCLMLLPGVSNAQDQAGGDNPPANQQAEDHIRLLEQMLREQGITPPPRPEALGGESTVQTDDPALVIPEDVQTIGLEAEVHEINERTDNAGPALVRVRRALSSSRDREKQQSAFEVLRAVESWAQGQLALVEAIHENDPVAAYMLAEDALQILRNDAFGADLRAYVRGLQADRDEWREIEAMAHYRRIIAAADALGLTGDWSEIDFNDGRVRSAIEAVRNRMGIVERGWPGTEGAQEARDRLREWSQREAQILADLPAWRYTWNVSLIHIGTESRVTYYNLETTAGNRIIIDEEIDQVFDRHNVQMTGTFQNTSDRPYRYTFVVGVSHLNLNSVQWTTNPEYLAGFTRIQTPVLGPGELYNWEAQIAVPNAYNIRTAGIAGVQSHGPDGQ